MPKGKTVGKVEKVERERGKGEGGVVILGGGRGALRRIGREGFLLDFFPNICFIFVPCLLFLQNLWNKDHGGLSVGHSKC